MVEMANTEVLDISISSRRDTEEASAASKLFDDVTEFVSENKALSAGLGLATAAGAIALTRGRALKLADNSPPIGSMSFVERHAFNATHNRKGFLTEAKDYVYGLNAKRAQANGTPFGQSWLNRPGDELIDASRRVDVAILRQANHPSLHGLTIGRLNSGMTQLKEAVTSPFRRLNEWSNAPRLQTQIVNGRQVDVIKNPRTTLDHLHNITVGRGTHVWKDGVIKPLN